MTYRNWPLTVSLLVATAACAVEGPPVGSPPSQETQPPGSVVDPSGSAGGTLAFSAAEPARVTGSYRSGDRALTFDAKLLDGDEYDIVIRFNGLTLTALGDAQKNYHDMDGFATANGKDSQLREADQELLMGFYQTYVREAPERSSSYLQSQVGRVAGYWSSLSESLPMQKSVMGTSERDVVSLCDQYLAWYSTTHDCSHGGDWGGGQWAYASIGEKWNRGAGGYFEHHYFTDSPRWSNTPQPHKGGSYLAGKCLGRCWAGCLADGSDQKLTQDCADHDQCATGNHGLTSFWCDDEAVIASDDGLGAGGACPGTGADPSWIIDWETQGYPNQSP